MLWSRVVCFALVSLALAHLQTALQEEAFSACPANFTQVGEKCLMVDSMWKTWYEADRNCRSLNAGLVSVENSVQLKLIQDWLPIAAQYTLEFWTSGNSLGSPGKYFWQNTGSSALYLPWATDQPQTNAGDCLTLYANYSMATGEFVMDVHRLRVNNCTLWAKSICETQPKAYKTLVCLNSSAFYEAQIPV
ncbi:C-type lectin 37Db-like [Drosophila tropicalis]|uniref:C-type lectin 37Db-like n=1 Tax=Drosophila tropicalis TaxID=46794 RepID=UPI0035ABF37A